MARMLRGKLSKYYETEHVILTCNGTTGIFLILSALGLKNKKVGIPNSVCFNVPLAVYFSGNFPVYLDIEKESLGLDPRLLNERQDLDVLIVVHAYGAVCQVDLIKKICQKKKIFLIEDCGVAQGAKVKSQPVGVFGDASILSFGVGKILEVGHGGAVICQDERLAKAIENRNEKLPEYSGKKGELIKNFGSFHTNFYNKYFEIGSLNQYADFFKAKALATKKYFLSKFDPLYEQAILTAFHKLDANVSGRNDKAEQFINIFNQMPGLPISIFIPPPGSVYWRFNIFIHSHRDEMLRLLLKKEYSVSSWQAPVDLYFEGRGETVSQTPISDWVGETILNLWVSDSVNQSYIEKISQEIIDFYGKCTG